MTIEYLMLISLYLLSLMEILQEELYSLLYNLSFLNNPKTYFPAVEEALSFIGYKYDINKFISKSGSKPSDGFIIIQL